MRTVFLDRDSLPLSFRPPRCASPYIEHGETAPEEAVGRLAGATVAIVNKVDLSAAELAQLPDLRMIAIAGTGFDCVDVDYCREHGIAVANVRDYAMHAVSEHVFALLLALRRNLAGYAALVGSGEWQRSGLFCRYGPPIHDLHGSVLGLVGSGSIGSATAKLGSAFGMRVLISVSPSHPAEGDGRVTLQQLLAEADVISLHCPLTPENRGLIGSAQLRAMKPGAILINTARGGLVDEAALVRALQEGWIAGAGLDVLSVEPPVDGNPLLSLQLPNLLITPHVGWASHEAMQGLADQLSAIVDAWAGGVPRNLVAGTGAG